MELSRLWDLWKPLRNAEWSKWGGQRTPEVPLPIFLGVNLRGMTECPKSLFMPEVATLLRFRVRA